MGSHKAVLMRPAVNNQSIQTEFSQHIRLPYFGEAYLARDSARPYWLSFFHREVCRTDSTRNQHGELDGGTGDIAGFTLRVGRWFLVVDRARVETAGAELEPLAWNKTAWLALGAPAVILSVIAAGLFKTFVAKPLGWEPEPRRPDLLPET